RRVTDQARGEIGHSDEEPEGRDERDAEDERVPALSEAFVRALELHVGRAHEHAQAVVERLPEHDDAAHERRARDPRALERGAERLAVAVDVAVRQPTREPDSLTAA